MTNPGRMPQSLPVWQSLLAAGNLAGALTTGGVPVLSLLAQQKRQDTQGENDVGSHHPFENQHISLDLGEAVLVRRHGLGRLARLVLRCASSLQGIVQLGQHDGHRSILVFVAHSAGVRERNPGAPEGRLYGAQCVCGDVVTSLHPDSRVLPDAGRVGHVNNRPSQGRAGHFTLCWRDHPTFLIRLFSRKETNKSYWLLSQYMGIFIPQDGDKRTTNRCRAGPSMVLKSPLSNHFRD